MNDVALLLLVAAAAYALRRLLHVPLIPMLLLAGMGLRGAGLALDQEVARGALDIGLAILVFGAGMELNPKRSGKQRGAVLGVGFAQFFFVGIGGVLISRAVGLDWLPALYVGLSISTTSTLIGVNLLKGRQQMFEPFGRLVTGVLLLQDLLIILMVVVLIRLPYGALSLLTGLGGLAVLLACTYIGLRWGMPNIVLRLRLDQDTLGLTIIGTLFLFMGAAYLMNLPIITGAFLAGVSLSAFPVNSVARGLIGSITTFFKALFFIVLGGLIAMPGPAEWLLAGALTFFILIATPLVVSTIAVRMRLTARSAIESGLLLAMTSEFSLVVVLQGLLMGQIPGEVFNVVAIVTVLTMSLTPLIATDRTTWALMHLLPLTTPRRSALEIPDRDHIVMLGYGKGGSVVLNALQKAERQVVVVNDDPVVVRELVERGIPAVYGDGSDPRILRAVAADRAQVVISSMRRVADAEKVMKHLGPDGPPLIIRVFEPDEAERIRQRGGIPVLSSEAAAEAFMGWFRQGLEGETPGEAA